LVEYKSYLDTRKKRDEGNYILFTKIR